jgi:hypothetical protein
VELQNERPHEAPDKRPTRAIDGVEMHVEYVEWMQNDPFLVVAAFGQPLTMKIGNELEPISKLRVIAHGL